MNENYLNLIEIYRKNNMQQNKNLKNYVAIDGFSKGNMDSTLYSQFENYVPRTLNENDPEILLMTYQFALIDLQLYLDVHPDDVVTKELFDKYLAEYNKVKKDFESNKYPVTLDSMANTGKTWKWLKNWPFGKGDK
mgnify:CR=1 FL=1